MVRTAQHEAQEPSAHPSMKNSPTRNGVKEIRLDSWREFFQLTTDLFATAPAFIYRGQTNYEWPLVSTLDRLEDRYPNRKNLSGNNPEFFGCPPFTEEEHLNAFKRTIRGRRGPNPPPLTEDDYWALAQHHGLATPLLDWTRSPFVALFFAFEEGKCFLSGDKWAEPDYRGVYILSTSAIETVANDDVPSVRLLSPEADANYRLISQTALSIRMPRRTNLEGYIAKRFADKTHDATFIAIKIPKADRDGCLVALNKMNINYMTLFPDIDGAAKHVNSLWQPGHEDSIAYV